MNTHPKDIPPPRRRPIKQRPCRQRPDCTPNSSRRKGRRIRINPILERHNLRCHGTEDRRRSERHTPQHAASNQHAHGRGFRREDGAHGCDQGWDGGDVLAVQSVGEAADDRGEGALHQQGGLHDPGYERGFAEIAGDERENLAAGDDDEDLSSL